MKYKVLEDLFYVLSSNVSMMSYVQTCRNKFHVET